MQAWECVVAIAIIETNLSCMPTERAWLGGYLLRCVYNTTVVFVVGVVVIALFRVFDEAILRGLYCVL